MKKIILLAFVLVCFAGCGMVNSFKLIGKNITRMASSHPYAVKSGEEAEILASNKGIVDMDFYNTGTAWVRITPEGVMEELNYTLTYSEAGATGRRVSQLPPGTYFLNGFVNGEARVLTGYYVRTSGNMENFGWDVANNRAKCFSFTIKAGETLSIPQMRARNYNSVCPVLDGYPSEDGSYIIGPMSKGAN